MPKVVVFYKLKSGATMKQYEKFSREIDQMITPKMKVVEKFEVFQVTDYVQGSSKPEKKNPPFEIFEIIDVKDFADWIKTTQSDAFKKVVDGWGKVGDGATLVMLGGKKIEK
ncbi:MAG: hypothetical protein JRN09_07410 [Nitrososphaerota archaeon]|jgi:hypothetical protein|nr:hypothetical protein [Nitrososphaerota archaeon]